MTAFKARSPLFKSGDRVVVVVPGTYRDWQGVVVEVILPTAGDVYRYLVSFADGANVSFFGFELAGNPVTQENRDLRDTG